MIKLIAAAALLLGGTALAHAQTPTQTAPAPMHSMPGMQMAPPAVPDQGGDTPATKGYRDAMQKMMSGMDSPYSGDPDRDFVTGMLPHHQGAIDMARIELQYGHDPAMKKVARDIIASQSREQAVFRRWLRQHPARS